MSGSTIPAGPWSWQWNDEYVGQNAQNIYNFLENLWSDAPIAQALWDELRNIKSEADIREFAYTNLHIDIPEQVRVILVDIQKAETKSYDPKIDPKKDPFYVLVIPPKPSRSNTKDYKDAQVSSEAWFHATTDGWGM